MDKIKIVFVIATIFLFFTGVVIVARELSPTKDLILRVSKEEFWAKKIWNKEFYDVLFLGDSRVYNGISSTTVAEELGSQFETYNFGFSEGVIDPFIFEKSIARLNKEGAKIIVFGLSFRSLLNFENQHYFDLMKSKSRFYFARQIEALFIPISRNEMIDYFHKLKKSESKPEDRNYAYYHIDQAWMEAYTINSDPLASLEEYSHTFEKNKFDELHFEKNMSVICQMKIQHNISILAFRFPASIEMWELEDRLSGVDFEKIKIRLKKCGINWWEITKEENRQFLTREGAHLQTTSAIIFSQKLGKQLEQVFFSTLSS